ncbi:MAG: hypothetical protein V7784_10380 [Oceanospirillaceae bacterium]
MIIRTMTEQDIEKVNAIEKTAWGDSAATFNQIRERMEIFPEGSIVAEIKTGKLIGYASSQLVNQISNKSWAAQTDNGTIKQTHLDGGSIAYGVSMSALPEGAKYSVGAAIIQHYYNIFIKSKRCSVLCLGSRLPGFNRWQLENKGDIKQYLEQSFGGYSRDPELRLYQKNGFQLLWEISNYYPDTASQDYGAMIVQR